VRFVCVKGGGVLGCGGMFLVCMQGDVINGIGLDVVDLALTIEIVSVIVVYMIAIEFRTGSAV